MASTVLALLAASHGAMALQWQSRDWSACFQSAQEVEQRVDLEVAAGAVPPALTGTVFKVGPGKFEAGDEKFAHWLDGDGFAFALSFRDGAASFVARFVETRGYADELAAGRVMWRTTFGTQRAGGVLANALDLKLKNPANTAMLPLQDAGLVLALWEAGPPHALDGATLDTLPEVFDFDGALDVDPAPGALPLAGLPAWLPIPTTDALSAHAKRCAASRRTVAWAWRNEALGDDLRIKLLEIDDGGRLARTGASSVLRNVAFAPHDVAVTEDHCFFVTCPTKVEPLPYILGLKGPAQSAFFDKARIVQRGEGATVHRVDRNGGGAADTYACRDAYHPIHLAGAWRDAEGVDVVLACCWPPDRVADMAEGKSDVLGDWSSLLAGDFSSVAVTQLVKFECRAEDSSATATLLARGAHLDHAKQHPAFVGRESRFVFASAGAAVGRSDVDDPTYATPQPPQAFVRVDVAEDVVADAWLCGPRRFVDDAAIVPRGDDDDDETAAWLVAPVFDAETEASTLVVLDAADLAAGPVCVLALPGDMLIPWALHGSWMPS